MFELVETSLNLPHILTVFGPSQPPRSVSLYSKVGPRRPLLHPEENSGYNTTTACLYAPPAYRAFHLR